MTLQKRFGRKTILIFLAVCLCPCLQGCLITSGPSLGGEHNSKIALAHVSKRIALGTSIEHAQQQMQQSGYSCRYTDWEGTKERPRPILSCSSFKPVQAATFMIHYEWTYNFDYDQQRRVTGIQIVDPFSHYS